MSLKKGLITIWVLATITIIKTILVIALCRFNIVSGPKMLLTRASKTVSHIRT